MSRRRLLALAAASPLAACASTPDVKAYLAGDGGKLQAAILGTRGPLTNSERGAVLASLPPDLSADALQRQFALQQALSESPLVTGNAATLLSDGAEALPAMFAAMRAASDSINLEYFIFADVMCGGTSLAELLTDRLRHGVVVNIIYDAYGSRDTPATLFETLRKAGARIVTFNPLDPARVKAGWSPNDRDHRKIMVVDGRVAFTGGINLDKVYENPASTGMARDDDPDHSYWRDTAMRIEGPAVAELQRLFFATWRQQKGPEPTPARYFPGLARVGVQSIRIIGSTPGDQRPLYYVSLMTAILSATQRVWLASGYFVPPHEEREDLGRTARAGIDVRLVAPSRSDVQAAVYAARAAYGDLLESGAQIYEMRDAVLHSKLATVDGVWSVVGSSNLDRRSVVFNNEVDAIILGRETATQVEAILQRDMAMSHEITLAEWRHRPFAEHWAEVKARLWQYWM